MRNRPRRAPGSAVFAVTISLVVISSQPAYAEVHLRVAAEFINTATTVEGTDDWDYFQSGTASVTFRNGESRLIRGELTVDLSPQSETPELKRLYIRPGFGPVLVSLGKTRSTWGAGMAFNAGDIIFGSESVDFNTRTAEPRSETAWLTNVEIPLGAFSFVELIVLPGNIESAGSATIAGATGDPSFGSRFVVDAGPVLFQSGYLFRGDRIAGLGETGHRAYAGLEGFSPVNWYVTTSAATDRDTFSTGTIEESWIITGGAFNDHPIGYDMNLAWRVEALVKPGASFDSDESRGLGVFMYPSITFNAGGTQTWSLSSVISPVDRSGANTLGMSWNIYEELSLRAYASVQTGGEGDVFNMENPGGIRFTVGATYVY